MKSARELVAEANSRVKSITAQEAVPLLNDPDTVFIDLRDSSELQREGAIPGAININRGLLEFALDPTTRITTPRFRPVRRSSSIARPVDAQRWQPTPPRKWAWKMR